MHYFCCVIRRPKFFWGYFWNFIKSSQRKQSPKERKFAQSDHPGGRVGDQKTFCWSRRHSKVLIHWKFVYVETFWQPRKLKLGENWKWHPEPDQGCYECVLAQRGWTLLPTKHGDQIGRILASWAIVYFMQWLENYKGSPKFLAYFFTRSK
jgi:hypothetical protein